MQKAKILVDSICYMLLKFVYYLTKYKHYLYRTCDFMPLNRCFADCMQKSRR